MVTKVKYQNKKLLTFSFQEPIYSELQFKSNNYISELIIYFVY